MFLIRWKWRSDGLFAFASGITILPRNIETTPTTIRADHLERARREPEQREP